MKYFFDTEFLEGTQKRFFGKTKQTIDLISIGIVSEDGREYYAVSKDFNLKEAWNRHDLKINKQYPQGGEYIKEYWIRENVLKPIFDEHYIDVFGCNMPPFCYGSMKKVIEKAGKSNKQIAEEIQIFTGRKMEEDKFGMGHWIWDDKPEFYAYYSAYDWVVFCWLFGKMIDLPKGFPMFCYDLKCKLDDKVRSAGNCVDDESLKKHLEYCKKLPNYPTQYNAHNALDDAKWNLKLYKFINTL